MDYDIGWASLNHAMACSANRHAMPGWDYPDPSAHRGPVPDNHRVYRPALLRPPADVVRERRGAVRRKPISQVRACGGGAMLFEKLFAN
jgi:hypothetical protein